MLRTGLAGVAVALLLAGCGAPDDPEPVAEPAPDDAEMVEEDEAEGPVANACPAEGCQIEIVDVVAEGDQLHVTWEANFLPDVSRNHLHVYWDNYEADQVSIDADARGVEQGEWDVTDGYPTYVTDGAASLEERGGSTSLCVTAADRDHVVLDGSLFDCRDVAELIES
jgi:hypothetical protein